ncbi:uncharacterized protein [Nicotiana sylvestris]|uniref:uncharacterized protein n=1 Tax=Nicotiana sylvestris TaxID=4096 RepID=UPI00388CDFDF
MRIVHQKIHVYTPQQNDVAERKHIHLLEFARAFKFQGHIPMEFKGHCALAATYVVNRLPSQAFDGKSPYELFFGKKPSISHLKTLGVYVLQTPYLRLISFLVELSSTTVDDSGTEGANTEDPIGATVCLISKCSIAHSHTAKDQTFVTTESSSSMINDLEAITTFPSPPVIGIYPDPLRRSQRESKEPVWLADYVTIKKSVNNVLYPIHNYVSYDDLSLSYQAYLGVFSSVLEPKTF